MFAALAIIASIMVVALKNPIYSVLLLVVSFFGVAGIYVLMFSYFMAIMEILVYAGAIVVLFIFAVMVINHGREEVPVVKKTFLKIVGVGSAFTLLLLIVGAVLRAGNVAMDQVDTQIGTLDVIARGLFTDYLIPFEVTSILLLAAIVGAVVLVKELK
jgi:NADH-quinone oxidoreductase subunit J